MACWRTARRGPKPSASGARRTAWRRESTSPPDGPGAPTDGRLTVFYDADCGICRLTILALEHLDWRDRLRPVPLGAFTGDGPTASELAATLHVRDARGRWTRGGRAARRIAGAIPVLMPLAAAGHLPGMERVMDLGYRAVANNRGRISRLLRLDSCAPHLRRI